jgi:hypothetical protein
MSRSLNHFARGVAGLGVIVLVAACGAKAPLGGARLVGVIEQCGGPAPGRCLPVNTPVSVLDQQRTVATTQAGVDGRFSFRLRPGTYGLAAMGPLGNRSVVAGAHRTVTANIGIHLR